MGPSSVRCNVDPVQQDQALAPSALCYTLPVQVTVSIGFARQKPCNGSDQERLDLYLRAKLLETIRNNVYWTEVQDAFSLSGPGQSIVT